MGYAKNKMIDAYDKEMAQLREEKYMVSSAMEKYGGSFVKALGVALDKADENNTLKIRNIFPEYWKKYLKVFIDSEQAGEQ